MKYLKGYKDEDVEFEIKEWDGEKIPLRDWNYICQDTDVIYLNYTTNDWMFASMGAMAQMHNVKTVMDMDDALWYINPDNTVYDSYKKGSKGIAVITDIVNACDYITCTNPYLVNVIANNSKKTHDKIEVFPNTVDLNLYNKVPEFKDTNEINIVHYGSSSHYTDLKDPEFVKAMDRLMQDYPNVRLLTVGSFFPEFKEKWGRRYEEEFGALNVLEWIKDRFPQVMEKTDIFVAPLTNNVYNRCKSDIKRSEVATAKKPFVGQNIRQYQEVIENGVDGFLCDSADSWYNTIKLLIDDKELRKSVGEKGYERMHALRRPELLVKDYCNFFKKVLEY